MMKNWEAEKMTKYLSVIGLLFVTIIWGGGFVASDIALDSLKPFQIMAIRFFLAFVLIGLIARRDLKKMKKKEIQAGLFMGIALFAGFAFQTVGLQYTTPSKNAFLTALNVVIVPFITFLFLKKKINKKGILGAVMAVVGVDILSLNQDFSLSLGDFLTLLCAVGFAFQIFLTSIYVKECRTMVINFIQMGTATVLSLVFMGIMREGTIKATTNGWLSVLYLGIVSTTLCFLLQTICQKYVEETKTAIILSMESVFGTIFSIWILKEQMTIRMMIGCAIILIAVIISNLDEGEEEKISDVSWERA